MILDNQKRDHMKYFVDKPTGFDPKHNEDVVNKTIEKYEKERVFRTKTYRGQLEERADAAYDYLKHLETGNKSTSAEKYFGKKELARLQGRKIIQRMKSVNGKQILTLDSLD